MSEDVTQQISFDINGNKITTITTGTIATQEDGTINSDIESNDWDESTAATMTDTEKAVINEDGTLKVSIEEFKNYFEKTMQDNGLDFNCALE